LKCSIRINLCIFTSKYRVLAQELYILIYFERAIFQCWQNGNTEPGVTTKHICLAHVSMHTSVAHIKTSWQCVLLNKHDIRMTRVDFCIFISQYPPAFWFVIYFVLIRVRIYVTFDWYTSLRYTIRFRFIY
jgi:hypothetical protein